MLIKVVEYISNICNGASVAQWQSISLVSRTVAVQNAKQPVPRRDEKVEGSNPFGGLDSN
jgi:hypothetical protein